MSQQTQFRLNLNGISLELEGDRAFVDDMYREIMRDIEEAKRRNTERQQKEAKRSGKFERKPKSPQPQHDGIIWVHRCSALVHKIYMANAEDLLGSPVLRAIDPDVVGTIYIEHGLLPSLMPRFERGQTLWAELTPSGRERIANAKPKY